MDYTEAAKSFSALWLHPLIPPPPLPASDNAYVIRSGYRAIMIGGGMGYVMSVVRVKRLTLAHLIYICTPLERVESVPHLYCLSPTCPHFSLPPPHTHTQSGAIACGVYATNNPEACYYIANDCSANIVIAENKSQVSKILQVDIDVLLLLVHLHIWFLHFQLPNRN